MAPLAQLIIDVENAVAFSADFDELAIYDTALPAATIWRHGQLWHHFGDHFSRILPSSMAPHTRRRPCPTPHAPSALSHQVLVLITR